MKFIILLFFTLGSPQLFAGNSDVELMVFSKWKEAQVIEAQNKVVRLKNQQLVMESSKFSESSKRNVAKDEVEKNDYQLRLAQRGEEVATELTLEDYISLYLSKYSSQKAAIKVLVSKMTDDELTEFIQLQLNLVNDRDVKVSNAQSPVRTVKPAKASPWKTL